MSLPKRPETWRPGALPLTIAELFGQVRLKAFVASGEPVKLLAETGGTLKGSLYGKDSGGSLGSVRLNSRDQIQIELAAHLAGTGTAKRLGGAKLAAATETTVYTTPASTSTVIQSITVSNGGGATTFSIGQAVGGGAIGDGEFFFENTRLEMKQTVNLEGPFYFATTDLLRATAGSANVHVQAWGVEWA